MSKPVERGGRSGNHQVVSLPVLGLVSHDFGSAVDDLRVKPQLANQQLEKGHAPSGRLQQDQPEVWAGDLQGHPWKPGPRSHVDHAQPWESRKSRKTGQRVQKVQPDDVCLREDPRQIQAPGPIAQERRIGLELGQLRGGQEQAERSRTVQKERTGVLRRSGNPSLLLFGSFLGSARLPGPGGASRRFGLRLIRAPSAIYLLEVGLNLGLQLFVDRQAIRSAPSAGRRTRSRGLPVRAPTWATSRGIGPLLEPSWPAPRRPSPRVLLVPPALWTPGARPSDLGAPISDFPTPLATFPGRSAPLPRLFLTFLRGLGSAPRHDDDAPEISIASACRGDGRVPLQSQVDDPPIPGIHWGKGNLPSCANDAVGSPLRERLKYNAPAVAIAHDVHFDPDRHPQTPPGHQGCQSLHGRKSLPVLPDEGPQVLSLYLHAHAFRPLSRRDRRLEPHEADELLSHGADHAGPVGPGARPNAHPCLSGT